MATTTTTKPKTKFPGSALGATCPKCCLYRGAFRFAARVESIFESESQR
jgi:hypothetical protein